MPSNRIRKIWAADATKEGKTMRDVTEAKKIVAQMEGCQLTAYRCPAGLLTIGYGHTGPDVFAGQVITQEEADALLTVDLQRACAAVARQVHVPLTDNQFQALVSFVFNIGEGAFAKSTLCRLLNAQEYPIAAGEFMKWDHGGGKVLAGLTKRREMEMMLFKEV